MVDYVGEANEIFTAVLMDKDIMNGIGVIQFVNPATKAETLLNAQQGIISGISSSNVKLDLVTRLTYSKNITEEGLAAVKKSRQPAADKLITTLITNNHMTNSNATQILREYFLGAMDELCTWPEIAVTWMNDAKPSGMISVPQVALSKLVDITKNRQSYSVEQAQQRGFSTETEFFSATYVVADTVNEADTELDLLNKTILTASPQDCTIKAITQRTNIPEFAIMQGVLSLEKNYLLSYHPAPSEELLSITISTSSIEDEEVEEVPEHIEEIKSEPTISYVSANPVDKNSDVVGLLTQLKTILDNQDDEIIAAEQNINNLNNEIVSLQAQVATLQVRLSTEQANKKELLSQKEYAQNQLRELNIL